MKYVIEVLKGKKVDEAMKLSNEVFDEFIAPNASEQGIQNFKRNIITNKKYSLSCKKGIDILYGAILDKELIGVIGLNKTRNHITLAFVKGMYQRHKVASSIFFFLLNDLKKKKIDIKEITLNSVSGGIEFYKSIGFTIIREMENVDGIMVCAMSYNLNNSNK